ncbi:hypothetical protein SXANM310S_03412 [Streptomyces xanthochromogenes]
MYLVHVRLDGPAETPLPCGAAALLMGCAGPDDGLEHVSVAPDGAGGPVLGLFLVAFTASLSQAERDVVHGESIDWVGHNTGGTGTAGVRRPVVERTPEGRDIVRFSYNLLTAGHYDPPVDAEVAHEELPLGALGAELAVRAETFFRENKVSVLIPENSILVWDNQRMLHARSSYTDARRHLTRYWLQ